MALVFKWLRGNKFLFQSHFKGVFLELSSREQLSILKQWIQDSPQRGHQHTVLPNFSEKLHEVEKSLVLREHVLSAPSESTYDILNINYHFLLGPQVKGITTFKIDSTRSIKIVRYTIFFVN